MSKSIVRSASIFGDAGPAPAAHNDRRPEHRQARLRQLFWRWSTACAIAAALVMAGPAASATEEPSTQEPPRAPQIEAAPLVIERQQIDGRLKFIDRTLDDHRTRPRPEHRSRLVPVEPVLPGDRAAPRMSGGVPPPDPLRSNDRRLSLERRGLEQRQQMLDRAIERMDGGAGNPSSGGLLERLRGDQK